MERSGWQGRNLVPECHPRPASACPSAAACPLAAAEEAAVAAQAPGSLLICFQISLPVASQAQSVRCAHGSGGAGRGGSLAQP